MSPSPEGISRQRWLNRASGFHRPGNSLSVDGTKSQEGVLKSRGFHPGRNYRSVDGVYNRKWQGNLPSAEELVNSRCRGQRKVTKWSPSRQKFPQCRWKNRNNSDHSCWTEGQFSCDHWFQLDLMVEGGLLGTYFHPLSVSVESDGARKASSATFFQRVETYQ